LVSFFSHLMPVHSYQKPSEWQYRLDYVRGDGVVRVEKNIGNSLVRIPLASHSARKGEGPPRPVGATRILN
jgi:hypothetical protein